MDAIKASMSKQYSGYLKGAILKYIWRMDYKGKAVEDLKKAAFYLERLIKEKEIECSDAILIGIAMFLTCLYYF